MKCKIFVIILTILTIKTYAQDSIKNIFDYSLEELMNMKVKIASGEKWDKFIDAPAIITVIDEKDIKSSGARDLIDLLMQIEGFQIGTDVENQIGVISRGLWAHEGKFLLLIDGQMMNELGYATIPLGDRIPLDNIKRIEIIKGSGSAVYGGFAELTVINIITKKGSDINGLELGAENGTTAKNPFFRKNFYLLGGKKINNFEFSLFTRFMTSARSNRIYTDIYGNTYNMKENSINPFDLNFNLRYKNFQIKSIVNLYKTNSRDFDGENLLKAYRMDFYTYLTEIKYSNFLTKKLQLIYKLNFKQDYPWVSDEAPLNGENPEYYPYKRTMGRYQANIIGNYTLSKKLDFIVGYSFDYDWAKDLLPDKDITFWNNKKYVSYTNHSLFIQSDFKGNFFAISLGSRLEMNSIYGFSFVPRVALRLKKKKTYIKLLYNGSYRTPSIENINLDVTLDSNNTTPTIKPENTDYINLELGQALGKNFLLTFNIFRIHIINPIIYSITETGEEGYQNFGDVGTKGFEMQIRYKLKNILFKTNYSFYSAKNLNSTDLYKVPGVDDYLLGASKHKFVFTVNWELTKKLNFFISNIYLSKKYGFDKYNASTNDMILSEYKPVDLLNTSVMLKNILLKNLTLQFSVYNILDTYNPFVQPYYGWHAPIPDKGREFIFKISYKFGK